MAGPAERAVAAIRRRSRVGRLDATGVDVHFHPDAVAASGRTVVEELVGGGRWRTQFETGSSNGGLTAFVGGDRWRWESRLFDGAYDEASPAARPAYGALRLDGDPYGSAPRFGSAYLRLRPTVLDRTTICFPDSVFEPAAVGSVDRAGAVVDALAGDLPSDVLDRYVEAHVHGGVSVADDVDALVLDPGFRGTAVEAAVTGTRVRVEWHPGYVLPAGLLADLAEYRGGEVTDAAARIAEGKPLDPVRLGTAVAAQEVDPVIAKRIWHLLAAFGRASDR